MLNEIITKPQDSLFDRNEIRKVKSLKPEEMEEFAIQRSITILSKIDEVSKKIEDADRLVEESKNANTDWKYILTRGYFGKDKVEKRSELNTQALKLHNEAMRQINNLIQESIRFTTCSASFAQQMIQTMAAMMAGGFKNLDGKDIQLSQEGQKHANVIINQAEKFLEHQEEMRRQDEEQDEQIQNNRQSIWELQKRLEEQENVDENQNARIEHNRKLIKDLEQELDEKDELDKTQSENIKTNQESIAKLQEDSQRLQEKVNQLESQVNKGKYGLFVSIGATILAIVAIILNFIIK